jgi:hypothetical protein
LCEVEAELYRKNTFNAFLVFWSFSVAWGMKASEAAMLGVV